MAISLVLSHIFVNSPNDKSKPGFPFCLVTSEGSLWLKQRRLMQPMFHREKIAAFGTMMTDCTQGMLDRCGTMSQRQHP